MAHGLGDELAGLGWRVSYLERFEGRWYGPPDDLDVVVVLLDDFDIRRLPVGVIKIAWAYNWIGRWMERDWFEDYDIVLTAGSRAKEAIERATSVTAGIMPLATNPEGFQPMEADPDRTVDVAFAHRARELRDALTDWVSAKRVSVLIGAPHHDVRRAWGDLYFARGLQKGLQRIGHPTSVRILPEWNEPATTRSDVVVHLFGIKEYEPRPGQVNLLWVISHPDLVTDAAADRYDAVLVASDLFAADLAARLRVPVRPLHQADGPRPVPAGCEGTVARAALRGQHARCPAQDR